MKVFISVDIEGCTGIVGFSQCESPNAGLKDWDFARRMMVNDVNAAIRGARAAGADVVVVKDAHNTCKNLLIDDLEEGVYLFSGIGSGVDGMMTGIDDTFDAAVLVGYHATAGTLCGVLEHALAGGLHRFWINGELAGEIAASAGVAGAYGVPLVAVTSDWAGCEEARKTIPGVQTYETKVGIGRYSAMLKHPSETAPGIENAVRAGVQGARLVDPYVVSGPVNLRIEFNSTSLVDLAATLPGVILVDGYTVEITRDDFLTAHSAMYNVFYVSMFARRADS